MVVKFKMEQFLNSENRNSAPHARFYIRNPQFGFRLKFLTSSVPLFLVQSTLRNRSEAKISYFYFMIKTPWEPSFYYLSISHYCLV